MKIRCSFFLFYFLSLHSFAVNCTKCGQETLQNNRLCQSCTMFIQMAVNKPCLKTMPTLVVSVQQQPPVMMTPQIIEKNLREKRTRWFKKYKSARRDKNTLKMTGLYAMAVNYSDDIWFRIQTHIAADDLFKIDRLQGLLTIENEYVNFMDDYTKYALYHSLAFYYFSKREHDACLAYYIKAYPGDKPIPKNDYKYINTAFRKSSLKHDLYYQGWISGLTHKVKRKVGEPHYFSSGWIRI